MGDLNIFISFICYGMLLALYYDGLRIIRRVFKHGLVLINIEDYIYWVVTGLYIFSLLIRYNYGVSRLYILLGLFLGAVIYNRSVSKILVKLLSSILKLIFTIIREILIRVLKKIKLLFKMVMKAIKKICSVFKRFFNSLVLGSRYIINKIDLRIKRRGNKRGQKQKKRAGR